MLNKLEKGVVYVEKFDRNEGVPARYAMTIALLNMAAKEKGVPNPEIQFAEQQDFSELSKDYLVISDKTGGSFDQKIGSLRDDGIPYGLVGAAFDEVKNIVCPSDAERIEQVLIEPLDVKNTNGDRYPMAEAIEADSAFDLWYSPLTDEDLYYNAVNIAEKILPQKIDLAARGQYEEIFQPTSDIEKFVYGEINQRIDEYNNAEKLAESYVKDKYREAEITQLGGIEDKNFQFKVIVLDDIAAKLPSNYIHAVVEQFTNGHDNVAAITYPNGEDKIELCVAPGFNVPPILFDEKYMRDNDITQTKEGTLCFSNRDDVMQAVDMVIHESIGDTEYSLNRDIVYGRSERALEQFQTILASGDLQQAHESFMKAMEDGTLDTKTITIEKDFSRDDINLDDELLYDLTEDTDYEVETETESYESSEYDDNVYSDEEYDEEIEDEQRDEEDFSL